MSTSTSIKRSFPKSPFTNPSPFNNPPVTTPPPPPPQSRNDLSPTADPAAAAAVDANATTATAATDAAVSPAAPAIVAGTQFSFDPPALALSPGEEQTVLLYASGADGLASSKLGIEFDPAVLQVSNIEPLNGGAVEPVSAGRIALTLPNGSGGISGSRAIARLTVKGAASGTGTLTLDATAMTLASGGPAIVSSSPAQVEVR